MTMFQIPKSASHPLDKYRQASIDYISGSQISVSGNMIVGGAITTGGGVYAVYENIVATTLTGSSAISGSTITATTFNVKNVNASGIITGSTISGSAVTITTLTARDINATFVSGSNTISGSTVTATTLNARDIGATNITGSSRISGSTMVTNSIMAQFVSGSNTISGAAFKGSLITAVNATGSANMIGEITFATGAGLQMTTVGNVITFSLA